jgi:hypothetical protein
MRIAISTGGRPKQVSIPTQPGLGGSWWMVGCPETAVRESTLQCECAVADLITSKSYQGLGGGWGGAVLVAWSGRLGSSAQDPSGQFTLCALTGERSAKGGGNISRIAAGRVTRNAIVVKANGANRRGLRPRQYRFTHKAPPWDVLIPTGGGAAASGGVLP